MPIIIAALPAAPITILKSLLERSFPTILFLALVIFSKSAIFMFRTALPSDQLLVNFVDFNAPLLVSASIAVVICLGVLPSSSSTLCCIAFALARLSVSTTVVVSGKVTINLLLLTCCTPGVSLNTPRGTGLLVLHCAVSCVPTPDGAGLPLPPVGLTSVHICPRHLYVLPLSSAVVSISGIRVSASSSNMRCVFLNVTSLSFIELFQLS